MPSYKPKRDWKKPCAICGKIFLSHYNQTKCQECKQQERVEFSRYKKLGISTSTVGAIEELRVSVDLMEKGFYVFRALSPSCPCDLFAMKNGKQFDIEVRTSYRKYNGDFSRPKLNSRANYFAWVVRERGSEKETIIYEPPLD